MRTVTSVTYHYQLAMWCYVVTYELQCNDKHSSPSESKPNEDGLSEKILDPATDVIIESLIGEASDLAYESSDDVSAELLKLDFDRNQRGATSPSDYCTTTTGSEDTSPPSTPNSSSSLKVGHKAVCKLREKTWQSSGFPCH